MAGRSFVVILVSLAALFVPTTDSFARDGDRRTIRCESEAERHSYCRTNTHGRVELRKRLSKAPCIEYETWGADRDGGGIWVRNGCRAEFSVVEHRWGRDDDDDRRPGRRRRDRDGDVRTIRCKSDNWEYNHCATGNARRARIVRQISDSRCIQGTNWGTDRRGIWVDDGCEAEFEVGR
jgi:hypothetical protein